MITSHFSSKLWQIVWARDRQRQEAPSGTRSSFLVSTIGALVFYMVQAVTEIFFLMHTLRTCEMVKWPLALSDCITSFIGVELGISVNFSFQCRQPVAYGFMIHKDGP